MRTITTTKKQGLTTTQKVNVFINTLVSTIAIIMVLNVAINTFETKPQKEVDIEAYLTKLETKINNIK